MKSKYFSFNFCACEFNDKKNFFVFFQHGRNDNNEGLKSIESKRFKTQIQKMKLRLKA